VPTDGELDSLDQFHIGGADATDPLIGSLAPGRGDRVLDVGSGFGGPARQIARRTGNRIVGIDITPAYVDAADDLSLQAGLGDLTEFRTGGIATFEPAICDKYGISELQILGSGARGTARPDSDILYTLRPGHSLGWEIDRLADEPGELALSTSPTTCLPVDGLRARRETSGRGLPRIPARSTRLLDGLRGHCQV
jgi:SAM-dependent methyltransferase